MADDTLPGEMAKFSRSIKFALLTTPIEYKNFIYGGKLNENCERLNIDFQPWSELCCAFNPGIYPFLKSCEYADRLQAEAIGRIDGRVIDAQIRIKESTELFDSKLNEVVLENENLKCIVNNSISEINELRDEQENMFLIVEKENNELKSLVYSLLEQLNELKENNKCLTSRICELELKVYWKKTPEIPNLIDLDDF